MTLLSRWYDVISSNLKRKNEGYQSTARGGEIGDRLGDTSLYGAKFEKNEKFWANFFNFSSSLLTGMVIFDRI